jgi:hypothetical protein
MIYTIISRGSLRVDSEDSLYDFIRNGIETNQEMFSLLEFVRWEYCSTDVLNDFFDVLSEHSYEINTSMWASLCARLVLSNRTRKQFPPSVKKGKLRLSNGSQTDKMYGIPDGIIAHLTREYGGNVHDRHVVDIMSGSFKKETVWSYYGIVAKNAADLETGSHFGSAYREKTEGIPHTRNNWICYDFKERRIVPTHYTIRTNNCGSGGWHLRSWLVETSADGKNWREVAREENNRQLDGLWFTGTFAVAGGGECRFIRLVNIGRNRQGYDTLAISAWEIFGSLFE